MQQEAESHNLGAGAEGPAPAPLPGPASDERLFLGIIALGILAIALVSAASFGRSRHEAAKDFKVSAPATSATQSGSSRQLIDFALIDRTGRPVNRADLEGKFLIVNFVFTGCSLACLEVNHRMAEIQRLLAGQNDVCLVSLTVDPQSDTPAALGKFAAQFGAETNRWLFLTGDKSVVQSLLEKSFLGSGGGKFVSGTPGTFGLTDRIAVVDTSGRLRAMLNGLKSDSPREVMEALSTLRTDVSVR